VLTKHGFPGTAVRTLTGEVTARPEHWELPFLMVSADPLNTGSGSHLIG
jgi:hypothetical protein